MDQTVYNAGDKNGLGQFSYGRLIMMQQRSSTHISTCFLGYGSEQIVKVLKKDKILILAPYHLKNGGK